MDIPRLTAGEFAAGADKGQPAVLAGAASQWPALAEWTPDRLAQRFGALEITPTLNLPDTGVPYAAADNRHRKSMTLQAFVDHLRTGDRCYMDQADLSRFPGLATEHGMPALMGDGPGIISLWLGSGTRSGLHYDLNDNFLAQIHGVKHAALVSPAEGGLVYPFGDCVTKSQVDPDSPDLARFPRFARATVWRATLTPGDVLYMPRGWWHYLHAPEVSVSLSCWYGQGMTVGQQVAAVNQAGAGVWLRVLRDFFWHGVAKRPYQQRLYSPPPTGKLLYDLLFGTPTPG